MVVLDPAPVGPGRVDAPDAGPTDAEPRSVWVQRLMGHPDEPRLTEETWFDSWGAPLAVAHFAQQAVGFDADGERPRYEDVWLLGGVPAVVPGGAVW